jgi:hypothetical protein
VHWHCSICGAEHDGLPLDWGYDAPSYWSGPRSHEDYLSSDLCVWTDDDGERAYFVRGVLHVPILGTDEALRYGVWSSLSERSFRRVFELWEDPARVDEPAYFGWLANSIPDYPETLGLAVDVVTVALDLRPSIVLHDGDHPLVADQRVGISMDLVHGLAQRVIHAGTA